MLGKPKYKMGEKVEFDVWDKHYQKHTLAGTVEIIDAWGTFEQNKDVSYDIMVQKSHFNGGVCLYKHIVESEVRKAEE